MTEDAKWEFINKLDEELLVGGVILSEWSTFLIRDADTAFTSGAHLAAILTALNASTQKRKWPNCCVPDESLGSADPSAFGCAGRHLAGIESHLKYEYGSERRERLVELIDAASITDELRAELHTLRQYRNRWVHVSDPHEDTDLLSNPEAHEGELEQMATRAILALRQTIYTEQWI